MPTKSEKQKTAANMAHAIKKGYIKPKAGTASAEMAKGMTDTQISHFRKEGTNEEEVCDTCNGQGWYATGETDKPEQTQCDACQRTGKKLEENQTHRIDTFTVTQAINTFAKYINSHNANEDVLDAITIIISYSAQNGERGGTTLIGHLDRTIKGIKQKQDIKEIIRNTIQEVLKEQRLA